MRILVFSAVIIGAALAVPALFQKNPQWFGVLFGQSFGAGPHATQMAGVSQAHEATGALSGRKVEIRSGRGGHFVADFRLNGRSVPAMVDTGATVVAINASTARRVGLRLSPADFRYSVTTANGTAKAAAAKLDSIQIGRIYLDDVEVAVLEDKALSGVLIGMSFLKRLRHYSVEDGALVLEQ